MMKMELKKKCEKCGKEGLLNQVDEVFHFPCKCHSKEHVITHYLCDACKDTFHVSPNKRYDVVISLKTFNRIMKAQEKYNKKFGNIKLDVNTMNLRIILNKLSSKLAFHIHWTYKLLTYMDDLYLQLMKDHSEKPPKDKKKSNPNSKYYPDGNDLSTSTAKD